MKITFKDFITEADEKNPYAAAAKKPAGPDDWPKFIADHYAEYSDAIELFLATNKGLYKGLKNSPGEVYISKLADIERKSKNTSNEYTVLFSKTLESWKDYPKRNRSMITTNNISDSAGYGESFYVFPKNGTELAICPKKDIWVSFKAAFIALGDEKYCDIFTEFASSLKLGEHDLWLTIDTNSWITVINDKIDRIERKSGLKDQAEANSELMNFETSSGETVYKILNKFLAPEKNGFKKLDIASIDYDASNEVWFDTSALMISADEFGRAEVKRLLNDAKKLS